MAKAIMVQGTTSNAGKSFLAAALCRIFRQDGWRVAPFKSQNMALNSFITNEGLEMGRAQVMQAEAAGIEPSVRMNPILLKPNSDAGSQVIVNGEVLGNMGAAEYYRYKKNLLPDIMKAYRSLSDEYDVAVLEGAGSPAEINLKSGDFVNMGMAKLAGAPVLLCGDIDRGGVFASLYGTIKLLEPDEQKMVKAMVINKFRGDLEILRPGLSMIEKLAGIPVAGVVPCLPVDLDDEDSLSERLSRPTAGALVDIAVIRLPKLSNFTDFNVLSSMPGVGLRYVGSAEQFASPDLVILPGTKNTMGDLAWMRQNGLEALVQRHAASGKPVFGVCGGYQMLGETLSDPNGVEHGGEMNGIGLLPMKTVFEEQKVRTRASGRFAAVGGIFKGLSGVPFEGYEIHMGRTVPAGPAEAPPLARIETLGGEECRKDDGCFFGNVYGTYLHGAFDREGVAEAVVSALFEEKGLDPSKVRAVDQKAYKERQYDLLAEAVRKSLDMDLVYRILEEGA